ncbi:MAG TPA: hypothetical protein VMW52_10900, partial [Phycisphaerae bacterium]|nr:hypothetical protein [Phycisphaerae bacterium]
QHHPGFLSWHDSKVTIAGAAPAQTAAGLGAIGSSLVVVTVANDDGFAANGAVGLNELVGGRIILNHGGGGELLMQNRRITANTAVAIGGGAMTVTLDRPLTAAVTVATSFIEVIGNKWAHMRGGLTTGTGGKASFGGAPVVALLNQYGWFRTSGDQWICPNSNPGLNANDREVFAQANGTIIGGEDATVESGMQRIGFIVENSADGDGPPIIHMQLE